MINDAIDDMQLAIAHGTLGTFPQKKCAMRAEPQHLKVHSFLETDPYSPMKRSKGLLVPKTMHNKNFNVVPNILRLKAAQWVSTLNTS